MAPLAHSLSHWLHTDTEGNFFLFDAASAKHKVCTISKFLFSTDPLLLLSPPWGLTKDHLGVTSFLTEKIKIAFIETTDIHINTDFQISLDVTENGIPSFLDLPPSSKIVFRNKEVFGYSKNLEDPTTK